MSLLDLDVRAANALGISYGYYKALTYDPYAIVAQSPAKKRRYAERSFTDEQAFTLWQAGMSDKEIGAIVGVSRQYIQRWRDQLELPVLKNSRVDPTKYRLATMQDGTTFIIHTDEV